MSARAFSAALALAFVTPLAACDNSSDAEPSMVWELAGFEAPESALPDKANAVIYVSNVNGNPGDKDGNGYISKVSLDGKMLVQKWVTGMDAPKGLALVGDKLFAADIDKLVEIDTKTGAIVSRYEAKDAKFLNDVAADSDGHVYVSDMATNTIWRLTGQTFEVWYHSDHVRKLLHQLGFSPQMPDGRAAERNELRIASWREQVAPELEKKGG